MAECQHVPLVCKRLPVFKNRPAKNSLFLGLSYCGAIAGSSGTPDHQMKGSDSVKQGSLDGFEESKGCSGICTTTKKTMYMPAHHPLILSLSFSCILSILQLCVLACF